MMVRPMYIRSTRMSILTPLCSLTAAVARELVAAVQLRRALGAARIIAVERRRRAVGVALAAAAMRRWTMMIALRLRPPERL